MKNFRHISVMVLGLILMLYSHIVSAKQLIEKRNYHNPNNFFESIQKDTIPEGTLTFELYFSEFGGLMKNLPVQVEISGNKIIVYNNPEKPLTGGDILLKGMLLKHKSGKWIIAQDLSEQNADEIGGCSDGPTPINFQTKIIEWC